MKPLARSVSTACFAAICAAFTACAADRPDTEGARVGVWTQDYEAAVALAGTNGLPLMLNFTGSDWCGWCKLMDRQVFSTDAWKKWAGKNIVLAFIDFPQNKSLVPDKYVARNRRLAGQYGVKGYPTYVVVEAKDGKAIGTLGASREATPEGFIADLENMLLQRPGVDLSKMLSPDELKRLEELRKEKKSAEEAVDAFREKAKSELMDLQAKLNRDMGDGATDAKAVAAAAQAALKGRIEKLDKEFEPLRDRAEKVEEEINAILKKARESQAR